MTPSLADQVEARAAQAVNDTERFLARARETDDPKHAADWALAAKNTAAVTSTCTLALNALARGSHR